MMRPSMSSGSEVRLFLSVLLSNRCVVEAWSLLRQHTTQLNRDELLQHVFETCQEMGLMGALLKLPFTNAEQECLEKFLQTSAGGQNQELLLVHHLQRANYIPALQLNQSMNVNLLHDRDPGLRERVGVRNSLLDQYGKVLPRVYRKLAAERAKPYHLSSPAFREVARPKPLSTATKQANAGNVHSRATFISNVLSKIGEVLTGNEQKTSFSQDGRITEPPGITRPLPDAELRDAFTGRPVTKLSRERSRLLDSVVRPVPSYSAAQSACRASTSFTAASPLQSNLHASISQRNFLGVSELKLLETPLVVKRAKVLATSASGFPGFTPQSGLRASLPTAPRATPSASPGGGSVTPPLPVEEPGVSFREESSNAKWTVGVLEESAVKPQTSEAAPEASPCRELHPSGSLQDSCDTLEEQFACDLPDGECSPESVRIDADPKRTAAVGPSKSARKGKSIHLQFTEMVVKDEEVQPSDQLLLRVPAERGERRKRSSSEVSEVSENSDLDLPKSLLPPTECKLPVAPRRSARKAAQHLLAGTESISRSPWGQGEILRALMDYITRTCPVCKPYLRPQKPIHTQDNESL
ncbi:protein ELYS-like [Chlamydotis macqueenii]